MSQTQIFLLGATGYIGGQVLSHLLKHPKAKDFQITVLVRSEEKAPKFSQLGANIKAVVGSTNDTELLMQLASEAGVLFSCADSDDMGATKTFLAGLKQRHEKTGTVPVLLHASGTGVLSDNAAGKHGTDVVYSDTNVEQIESLSPTQIHRNVDLEIVEADKLGYVKTYIIIPSVVYGVASSPLIDLGLQNPHSILVPVLFKASLDRGQGGTVGEGKNIWQNVHVDDLAALFITVFEAATNPAAASELAGHGREGFYFGENGEHTLYDACKVMAQALYEKGKSESSEPTTFSEEELQKYFGFMGPLLGSNSRCRADRARAIGWNPVYTTEDFLKSIPPELDVLIKKSGGSK
ncbi:NAD(P)-binding protein [Leucogyrophana mollusca]|uniref:NAD(P)-binding protein n=1 Tax=Leucogyrophana mollusca TaxID=85980 RepID=A0ACB8BQH9_9AGAM|nr:NAD(P)-binding protein [Leucogyrophana mollusca]